MKQRSKSPLNAASTSSSVLLLIALNFAAGLAWADNKPWKGKPYSSWDDKDIQVIMTESPWVVTTSIRRTWLPVAEKDVPPQQQIGGGVRSMPQASPNVSGASPAAQSRESEESQMTLNVYVYWDSSRVMREAQARQRVLHGQMNESDVDAYLHQPQDEYILVLSMGDMSPFIRNDEKFFQANSFLDMKKGKVTLTPSHVVYQRDGSGALKQAVFFFSKKSSAGEPVISSDETDVTFRCRIADSTLRVGFKPKQMADASGPDL